MEVLNPNLENVVKHITYAFAIAEKLMSQKDISEGSKVAITRLGNALTMANEEISRYVAYGFEDARDNATDNARNEFTAIVNKHKEKD